MNRLETALREPDGQRLGRALDLSFALDAGFNITLDDISQEMFNLLKLIAEKRQKYSEQLRRDEMKRQSR